MKKLLYKLREAFNDNSTGMGYYDDVISDQNYAERKQRFTKVIYMSPKKYIEACVEGFNTNKKISGYDGEATTFDSLISSRTDDSLEELKQKLQTKDIDMPVLEYQVKSADYIYFTQEGIHRAIAAMQLGYDKIPVLICVSRDYQAGPDVDNTSLKQDLEFFSKRLQENYKEANMNIPQLLEKLKKFVIEPQEPFLDEMEDESGVNKVEECMAGSATPSIGPAPTPAFSQVKVDNKPVQAKSKKKKQDEEYKGDIYKVIKYFKDGNEEIHNDVLFQGSEEECNDYVAKHKIRLQDKRKPVGKRPQYFIKGFENHSYKKHDPEVIKRNQRIITNSNIGEKYSLIHRINSLCEEINTSIDDVIIAWLDKLNFKNLKSEKGFIYKNSQGNFLHYIIFNKPNKVKYIVKNIDNQTIFSDEWQVKDPEDTEELFRKTIGPKFDSFE